MKPVQPASRSNAAAFFIPSVSAISADVVGKSMSGVTVAQMIRSISDGSAPASASASRTAGSAMSLSASSCTAKRRSLIPVRSWIHSSEVSTSCARSSFVITLAGTFVPRPVMPIRGPVAEPIIVPPRT